MDVDVSKLRLLNARKPTLDIRLRDQPVGPTVNTILESETQHESYRKGGAEWLHPKKYEEKA